MTNSGIGSFPVSPALPAKIDIITFVFLFITLSIFAVCLAVYTAKQTKKILSKINKTTKVIISIFAGRAGDTGKDPIPEFVKSIEMAKKYKNVEILWASVREPYNYIQAKQLGCHIITIPPSIIHKIKKFGKSFDQLTVETVRAFLLDSKKSKFKI